MVLILFPMVKSEEEVDTTEDVGYLVVSSQILAVAITNLSNNVLERSVVSTDLPSLLTSLYNIERVEEVRVLAEVTVSNPRTPGALVLSLCALVGNLSTASLLIVVSIMVLSIETVHSNILAERVSALQEPDVSFIRRAILISRSLTIILDIHAVQMVVISTNRQLAERMIQTSILVVSYISSIRIGIIQAASPQRQLRSTAEGNLSTGERRIEDAVIIDLCELTELHLEALVVALCPYTFQRNVTVAALILSKVGIGIETSLYMPVAVYFSRRLETEL